MTETADEVSWYGDAEERFQERAIDRELYGHWSGHPGLGRKFMEEVLGKIQKIAGNLNLYEERDDSERVAPLKSGYVLVYKKIYFVDSTGTKRVRFVIMDVRRHY